MTTRAILHRHLNVEAWHRHGLSPANRAICLLILFGGTFAILSTEPHLVEISPNAFGLVELLLATLFAVESVARLYAAGEEPAYRGLLGRLRYMATPLAIIDLIGMLRLAKFGRYSHALRHLTEAVRMRAFELGLGFAVACFFLVLTATLLYLVEGSVQPAAFGSIPRAMWWSVMTLTTVGYGDVYPVTVLGRICAGATAVIGIGLIAMLTGILAAAFSEVFQKHREQVAAAHAAALARKAARHEQASDAPKAATHEPIPDPLPDPTSPCQTCGACCETDASWPRFSLEHEADLALIPPALVKEDGSGMACEGDRCKALAGKVGEMTACTIYGLRPDVCRACLPGDEACAIARAKHGMAVLG